MPSNLKILLFSEKGFGGQYNGAGQSAHTLYGYKEPSLVVDLLQNDRHDVIKSDSLWSQEFNVRKRGGALVNATLLFFTSLSVILKGKYSIVHLVSGYWLSMVVLLSAKLCGKKVVVKITSTLSEARSPSGLALKVRSRQFLLRRADCVIAISEEIAEQLKIINVRKERIFRLPNAVDTSRFGGGAKTPRKGGPLRILYCGSVVPRKRLHLLLEALPIISVNTDVRLSIVGPCDDYAYKSTCEDVINRFSLKTSISWHGFVGDVAPLFQHHDILCLPSKKEGMANVVLEAMASGTPFVVTGASGMRELAETGGGVMVRGTPEGVADGVLQCLEQYHQMSTLGVDAAKSKYDTSKVFAALLDQFQRISK